MKRIDYLDNKTPEPKEEPPKETPVGIDGYMRKIPPARSQGDENWTVTELAATPIRNDMGGVLLEIPWGTLETTSNTITDPTEPRGLLGATIYGGRVIQVTHNDSSRGNSTEFIIRFDDDMYIRTTLDQETIRRSNIPLIELLTNQVRGQRRQTLADRPLAHRPIRSMIDGFNMGFELAKPVLKPNIFKRALNWIRKK